MKKPFLLAYLLQLVGLGFVFIAVGVLAISHAQPPHSQDAVHVIPHPGILLLDAGGEKSSHWVLREAESSLQSTDTLNVCNYACKISKVTAVSFPH